MSLFVDLYICRSSVQERHQMPFSMFLAAVSGWTNLIVAFCFPFSFMKRFFGLRLGFTLTILLCLAATVLFFTTTSSTPLIGYFVWLSGIAVIIFPFAEVL